MELFSAYASNHDVVRGINTCLDGFTEPGKLTSPSAFCTLAGIGLACCLAYTVSVKIIINCHVTRPVCCVNSS